MTQDDHPLSVFARKSLSKKDPPTSAGTDFYRFLGVEEDRSITVEIERGQLSVVGVP